MSSLSLVSPTQGLLSCLAVQAVKNLGIFALCRLVAGGKRRQADSLVPSLLPGGA